MSDAARYLQLAKKAEGEAKEEAKPKFTYYYVDYKQVRSSFCRSIHYKSLLMWCAIGS
jgi:hypothetical protein